MYFIRFDIFLFVSIFSSFPAALPSIAGTYLTTSFPDFPISHSIPWTVGSTMLCKKLLQRACCLMAIQEWERAAKDLTLILDYQPDLTNVRNLR
jgi:hypothetical protein